MPKKRDPNMVKFVESWYPSKGAAWCADRLECPITVVYCIASELGIRLGDIYTVRTGREMLVADLALEMGGASRQAIKAAAKRDGVLKIIQTPAGTRNRTAVPRWWADEHLAEYREALENAENYSHYIPLPQAAEMLGVGRETLTRYISEGYGRTLKKYLGDVHVVRGGWDHGGYRQYLLEPRAIDEARRQLDEDRRLARYWVTVKSLVIDCGVTRKSIVRAAIRFKKPHRVLLSGGTLAAFVSPDTAAKIRQHFNADAHESQRAA